MSKTEIPGWVQDKRRKGKTGRPRRYNWAEIEVGASLLIPVVEQTCTYRSFYVMAHARAKELGRRFHVRKREDGVFECWRER